MTITMKTSESLAVMDAFGQIVYLPSDIPPVLIAREDIDASTWYEYHLLVQEGRPLLIVDRRGSTAEGWWTSYSLDQVPVNTLALEPKRETEVVVTDHDVDHDGNTVVAPLSVQLDR